MSISMLLMVASLSGAAPRDTTGHTASGIWFRAEGAGPAVLLVHGSAHAELLALQRAAAATGHWPLEGCALYVTLEPCAMCAGAIVLARVPRVVVGAPDPKAGVAGSLGNLLQDDRLNHRVELTAGVLADGCGEVLRAFFRERR